MFSNSSVKPNKVDGGAWQSSSLDVGKILCTGELALAPTAARLPECTESGATND